MTATIESIKGKLTDSIGENVVITEEVGRRKTTTHEGKLTETYPSVFVVELEDSEGSYERVSYSYIDVLTNTIEIDFPDLEQDALSEEELNLAIDE